MNQYLVRFYKTRSGGTPAQEFLMQLDKKLRANMMSMITLLQEKGPDLRMPYRRHLSDGIFELRAKQGTNICRMLFFFCPDQTIILTNGFVKKTQKTPFQELYRAKKYRMDYFLRRDNDQNI